MGIKLARFIEAIFRTGYDRAKPPRTLSQLAHEFPAFRPEYINQEAIADRLKLDDLASAEALANRPASDAAAPDHVERQIEAVHRGLLDNLVAATQDSIAAETLIQQRAAHRFAPHRLDELVEAAVEAYHAGVAQLRARLAASARDCAVAGQHLRAFKQRYHLQREASYPRGAGLHRATVIAVAIVEAILNAGLFAEASSAGIVGGFLVAAAVAAPNIAGSYAVGVVLRGINTSGPRRFAAFLGVAAWACLLPVYHLTAGHLRSALKGPSPDTAMASAITALVTSPFSIQDALSWLLVLVGLGAAAFAVRAGYTADDAFPGFGDVDRRAKEAATVHGACKDELLATILKAYEPRLAEVDQRLHDAHAALEESLASLSDVRQIADLSRRGCNAIAESFAGLVRRYRHINTTIRTTPAPAYFGEHPRLLPPDGAPVCNIDVPSAEEAALDARKKTDELRDTAIQVKRRLRQALQARLEDIPRLIDELEGRPDGEKQGDKGVS